ncbi:MAG TPA: VOC family protein [Thermoleophilaceae bacterium]|nr:VOC family protein [Thermoleophilaceae bacterium]
MSTTSTTPTLPDTLRLGPVHIAVTDLERSKRFYARSIGLQEHGPNTMGAGGEDLLVLEEQSGGRPAGRHAGLYHFALLHPSRLELSRAARRLLETSTPISGASDHGISEAIYLPDPDGNGIELAADRGRERWGDLSDPKTIGPAPLDMADLLSMTDGEALRPQADPGLVVGHVHLHVGDIERALAFYRDLVGFEVMTQFPSAAFIAAGGYHHHLGLNTWRGEGVPAAPPDALGLRRWTVVLDGPESLAALRERLEAGGVEVAEADGGFVADDPWRNRLLFVAGD